MLLAVARCSTAHAAALAGEAQAHAALAAQAQALAALLAAQAQAHPWPPRPRRAHLHSSVLPGEPTDTAPSARSCLHLHGGARRVARGAGTAQHCAPPPQPRGRGGVNTRYQTGMGQPDDDMDAGTAALPRGVRRRAPPGRCVRPDSPGSPASGAAGKRRREGGDEPG